MDEARPAEQFHTMPPSLAARSRRRGASSWRGRVEAVGDRGIGCLQQAAPAHHHKPAFATDPPGGRGQAGLTWCVHLRHRQGHDVPAGLRPAMILRMVTCDSFTPRVGKVGADLVRADSPSACSLLDPAQFALLLGHRHQLASAS